MEILTSFEPYGDHVLIEHVFEISNLSLHNIKSISSSQQKVISTKIVKVGDSVEVPLIGKTPMFTSSISNMISSGAAYPVYDLDNTKSIASFEVTKGKDKIQSDIKSINGNGYTEFVEYVIVNINYIVGLK